MSLYRLVYRSEFPVSDDRHELEAKFREIAVHAAALNAAADLTGALMLGERTLLQAIEGPLDAVETTFERICGDVRHQRLQLVEFASVPERVFAGWPLAMISTRGALSTLCAQPDLVPSGRLDPATVEAMLELMRTLILTNGTSAQHVAAA